MSNFTYLDPHSIEVVEGKRKKLNLFSNLGCFGSLVFVGVIIYLVVFTYHSIDIHPFFFIIPPILAIIIRGLTKAKYEGIYKKELVEPNVKRCFPSFVYREESYIDSSEFQNSGLFGTFNRYRGDDLFTKGGLSFSELHVKKVTKSSSGNNGASRTSGSSSSTTPIFDGVFLTSDLPFGLEHDLTIRTKPNIDKIPNFFKKFLPKDIVDPQNVITSGNEVFDNAFLVQCADSENGVKIVRTILNSITDVNRDVTSINLKESITPTSLAIRGKKLYFAVSGVTLFETKINKRVDENTLQLEYSMKIINNIIKISEEISSLEL